MVCLHRAMVFGGILATAVQVGGVNDQISLRSVPTAPVEGALHSPPIARSRREKVKRGECGTIEMKPDTFGATGAPVLLPVENVRILRLRHYSITFIHAVTWAVEPPVNRRNSRDASRGRSSSARCPRSSTRSALSADSQRRGDPEKIRLTTAFRRFPRTD